MTKCVCCEKSDNGGGLCFTKHLLSNSPDETVICMDCVVLGARYIVTKAREALAAESEGTEGKKDDVI